MQPQRPQPKSPPARSWSCSTGQSHFPQWQLQPACAPSAGCNRHCSDTLDKVPRLKAVTEAPPELSAGKYQRSPTSSRPASTANWQLPSATPRAILHRPSFAIDDFAPRAPAGMRCLQIDPFARRRRGKPARRIRYPVRTARSRRRFPAWSDRTARSGGRSKTTAYGFHHTAYGLRNVVPAWRSGADLQPRYLATCPVGAPCLAVRPRPARRAAPGTVPGS